MKAQLGIAKWQFKRNDSKRLEWMKKLLFCIETTVGQFKICQKPKDLLSTTKAEFQKYYIFLIIDAATNRVFNFIF